MDQDFNWRDVSSEVCVPCPGCIWTLLFAHEIQWQEYGRGHDRRVGLRLVRRLRRRGCRARLVPSSAVERTVGQTSSWYAELERDLREFDHELLDKSMEPF